MGVLSTTLQGVTITPLKDYWNSYGCNMGTQYHSTGGLLYYSSEELLILLWV